MKWILIIYFMNTGTWLPDKVVHYTNKQDCIEARDDLKKNPNVRMATCAEERK